MGGKNILSFALCATLLSASAFGQNEFLVNNKFFYTLSPTYSLPAENPVFHVGDTKAEYVKSVFKEILNVCSSFTGLTAQDADFNLTADQTTLIKNDKNLFWVIMTGCLAIPYHESRLTHFRKVDTLLNPKGKTICSMGMNNGQYLTFNKKLHDLFVSEFQNKGLVTDCSNLIQENEHTQLAGSSDYLSTGMMQVTMNWNKEHIQTGEFLNVRSTLFYGLRKYVRSVVRLYSNFEDHECLVINKQRHYANLVQAAWSGDYNSGNDSKSCRFTDPTDAWAANDDSFKISYDALLSNDNLYKTNLTGDELKTFNLIVSSISLINGSTTKSGNTTTLSTNKQKLLSLLKKIGIE